MEEGALLARLGALPLFAASRAPLTLTPLAGLTNQSVKVEQGGESYAFRLPGRGTGHFLDRAAEADNARLAAQLGIAPALLFFDPADGAMLTRFRAGRVLDAAALKEPDVMRRAVLLLRRLHASGAPFRGTMDLFAKLAQYLVLAEAAGAPASLALMRAVAQAQPIRSVLAAVPAPLVPSHVDPVPHNFLLPDDGGALLLLDWEYAAMADPSWDLADLSAEAGFDAAQDRAMLALHDDEATPRNLARLALFKAGLHLLAAAWAHLQPALGNAGHDFAGMAEERLAAAERQMARGDFADALRLAGGLS